MDLKKTDDSNIISIMDPIPEALEAPTPEQFEALYKEPPFFDVDTTADADAEGSEQKRMNFQHLSNLSGISKSRHSMKQ